MIKALRNEIKLWLFENCIGTEVRITSDGLFVNLNKSVTNKGNYCHVKLQMTLHCPTDECRSVETFHRPIGHGNVRRDLT